MPELMAEVERFRHWADAYPYPVAERSGDWECNYESWEALHVAVLEFTGSRPFDSWSEAELRAVLYAIARDNELQHLASTIRRQTPALVGSLARAALTVGEQDDRWQLAVELGHLGPGAEAEQPLLAMAHDEHEYVRRHALESLTRIGSAAAEEIALAAWDRSDEHQQWARMMALYCLQELGSPHLEALLAEAEKDPRQYLREYAERIRRGESLDF